MKCTELSVLMSSSLDEPPDEQTRSVLQAHLQSCAECRRLWSALQDIDRLFRASSMATAPAWFVARTVAAATARRHRQSVVLGLVALLWGAIVVAGLSLVSLLGNPELVAGLLGIPAVLTEAPQWLALAGQVLVTAGQMAWSLLWTLRGLATVPIVAFALMVAMSSGLVVLAVLMRTGEHPAPSLL